ncbi:hypothetical protein O181_053606 [Austropuccinia psidii MF-1]|uniref:Uncharacterized protein n=1 Tax=Austropuccinia psidii MF-1 TaxID=1389203 RepID=A0A9Q3E7T7_9BASI|nr:hypothetical protein [Austropuccinia psidii MF-1]
MVAIRRPFKDPNHRPLQELGWKLIQDYFKGHSQRLYIISISCKGIKYFNTAWTTQLVHTGGNQSTCIYLAQLGQFIFHCGNSSPCDTLDGISQFPQLRAHLERGLNLEGAAPSIQEGRGSRRLSSFSGVVGGFPGLSSTTFKGPGAYGGEEQENSVEEEYSNGTEGVPAPVGASQGTGGTNIAQSNQPVCHQS